MTPGDTGADACDLAAAFVSTVEVDEGCGFEADAGTFEPVVEWQWGDNVGSSRYDDVMSTPVVGDVQLELRFVNRERNLQLLLPFTFDLTWGEGARNL